MKNEVVFERTTKGYVGSVNGKIRWFIRFETKGWYTYFSLDGLGFTLKPSNIAEGKYGYETLEQAQQDICRKEQEPQTI